jgi:predicted nucleic acid-binding protein
VIVLDTSAIFALLNRRDPDHGAVSSVVHEDRGPYVVPAGILAEVTYLVEKRLGDHALDALLTDLDTGGFAFDCGESDWARVRELVVRYADLPLGAADASVIACAERTGGPVVTLDRRDFGIVAQEGGIRLLL